MALDFLRGVLTILLLAGGLLVPGWLLGRVLRTPAGPLGAFLGSAAILLHLVLFLDALGLAINAVNLSLGLALLCGILALLSPRSPAVAPALANPALANPAPANPPPHPLASLRSFQWQPHHWFFLPAALGLAALALRAALTPLSGFDTIFRWNFLALQMLREGSLHFYPAVTAQDFVHYGWPDGIAPLVSSLYLWGYVAAGHTAPWLTAPVVIGQGALLFFSVWQLAARHDRRAGALACAVLATSSVFLWGVAMGQETGLTALGLVAMFLFLERHHAEPASRWLVWAGLAAGIGALAREYGLVYVALGLFGLAWERVPARRWPAFVLAFGVVALPWYLRNWFKTGHPLYSHSLGGLFPGNPVLADYNLNVAEYFGLGTANASWANLAALAFGLGSAALVFGFLGAAALRRTRLPWLVAFLTIIGLWFWSIRQTSAGPGYAVRLLTPALALGAVLGGVWLARFRAGRPHWLWIALLTVASVDAAIRSLYLPVEAEVRWWQRDWRNWREFDRLGARWRANPNWAAIADAAAGYTILVPDPASHAQFVHLGLQPIPHFSPAVRFLFAPDADFATCLARLRAERVRFILTTRQGILNDLHASRYPYFLALSKSAPTAVFGDHLIYDLYAPPP